MKFSIIRSLFLKQIVFSFLFINPIISIYSQDSLINKGKYVFIQDRLLKEHVGLIGSVNDSTFILFKNVRDSILFLKKDILKVTPVNTDNILGGKKITEDEFYTLGYINSTAFPLKKSQLYYTNTNLIYNSLRFGLGNKISLAINSSPVLAPVGVSAKYSFRLNDQFYLGTELGYANGSWWQSNLHAYHLSLKGSQGSSQHNSSLGVGYFNINGFRSISKKLKIGDSISVAYVNFSLNERFSKKFSLNLDLWYFNSTLLPISNSRSFKTDFYLIGLFLRSHNLPEKQWRFGLFFLVVKPAQRDWITVPIPVIQYNYLIGR